jgi:DivIVA domain-containing protein
MGELLLFIVVALTVAAIVFGVTVMVGGGDPGLTPVEPDGRALPLPGDRPLGEEDVVRARFDTALRGYRMSQVDQALQRAAYDIGYKGELISVLEAEVTALREGRIADADVLRRAREAAAQPVADMPAEPGPATGGPATGSPPTEGPPGADLGGSQVAADGQAAQAPAAQAPTAQGAAGESPAAVPASSAEARAESSPVGQSAAMGTRTADSERAERR